MEEEDQNQNALASIIFTLESIDGILDSGVAVFRTIELLKQETPMIPSFFTMSDLLFLLDEVETSSDFTEKTFYSFFNQCATVFQNEFPSSPPLEEDAFILDNKFIQERLSDVECIDKANYIFTFTSFLVQECEIAKIDALINYKALAKVELQSNNIFDISPLTELPRLKVLDLSKNRVTNISSLHFNVLEELNLKENAIVVVDSLFAPNLKTIDLSENKILFISPFAFKTPLIESINLSHNNIRDLKANTFGNLPLLKTLKIDNLQIKVFTLRSELKHLINLDISENPLESVRGISELASLEELDMHKTSVVSPHDLFKLQNLKKIIVAESTFGDQETARLDLVYYIPSLIEIDESPVTSDDRVSANELFIQREEEAKKRAEEELAKRLEEEQQERLEREADEQKEAEDSKESDEQEPSASSS